MNIFDSSIIKFINSFARKSEFFDISIDLIVGSNLIKGGFIVSILWFFWFKKNKEIALNRERIIIGLASCIIAIIAGRTLALLLPFRLRPFFNPNLHFILPYGREPANLETWSSFPSDHAILFFSLATAIFLISRKVAMFIYLYILLFICFPRIYMGYHHPTDIIAGAIIGISITLLISIKKISHPFVQRTLQFSTKYPGWFFVIFFLLTFQISTLFGDSRVILSYLFKVFKNLVT